MIRIDRIIIDGGGISLTTHKPWIHPVSDAPGGPYIDMPLGDRWLLPKNWLFLGWRFH